MTTLVHYMSYPAVDGEIVQLLAHRACILELSLQNYDRDGPPGLTCIMVVPLGESPML